jgi:hypothetical protein
MAQVEPPALPAELAVVGSHDAGEDLQQRRLAGAVLADHAVHLAGLDAEAHVGQRANGAERLGDVLELEPVGHGGAREGL